jgi:hypothetical protein
LVEQEIYSQKELINMINDLKDDMGELRVEMRETKILIRDYNGLRKRLQDCEKKIGETAGQSQGSRDMWGYVVGAGGLIIAILSVVIK